MPGRGWRVSCGRLIPAPSSSPATRPKPSTWWPKLGEANLKKGDEIVLTILEHHSNIVPGHMIAERTGAVIRFAGMDADGNLNLGHLEADLGSHEAGRLHRGCQHHRHQGAGAPVVDSRARSARSPWLMPPRPRRISRSMSPLGTAISWP
jgi:hypothetical protein